MLSTNNRKGTLFYKEKPNLPSNDELEDYANLY